VNPAAQQLPGHVTGARKRKRKTGTCISGVACRLRNRSAMPAAKSSPVTLMIAASPYIPNSRARLRGLFMPTSNPTSVTTVIVIAARINATTP